LRDRTSAKEAIAHEEAYRRLAEQASAALATTADEQERIANEHTDLRVKVTAIEKLVREVERAGAIAVGRLVPISWNEYWEMRS
jgi:hypothetical protein